MHASALMQSMQIRRRLHRQAECRSTAPCASREDPSSKCRPTLRRARQGKTHLRSAVRASSKCRPMAHSHAQQRHPWLQPQSPRRRPPSPHSAPRPTSSIPDRRPSEQTVNHLREKVSARPQSQIFRGNTTHKANFSCT